MSDIVEIDGLITKSRQKHLYDLVTDMSFNWHHLEDATFEKTIENKKSVPSFCHLLYNNGAKGPYFDVFYPVLLNYLDHQNLKLDTLLRMRLGFLLNTAYSMPHLPYSYNNPHVDFEEPHMVGLYYLNDTDGDTVVFNQTAQSDSYSVKHRIKPNAGKFAAFDGKYYHASSCPKMFTTRIVLTYNFAVK
jgi:hypothetical protein